MGDLFDFYVEEVEREFSGWDFSYITRTDRMVESQLEWSYASEILPEVRKAEKLLDMGTGGGEFLSLLQPLPAKTFATEGYKPNIPLAREKLEPLGVTVVKVEDDNKLDFGSNYFDLIINRHESYSSREVKRILKPRHLFITQQVGGKNCLELNELLEAEPDFGMKNWNLDFAVNELEESGFIIVEALVDFPKLRFYDIGAVIFYLKAISWQIPDFTVNKYYDKLQKLHHKITKVGFLDIQEHRFFIKARNGK